MSRPLCECSQNQWIRNPYLHHLNLVITITFIMNKYLTFWSKWLEYSRFIQSDGHVVFAITKCDCKLTFSVQSLTIIDSRLGQDVIDRYTFFISDECLIAPNALFYPDLFELTCNKNRKRVRYEFYHSLY